MACYILANLAFLNIFGLNGLRESHAVAADLMNAFIGRYGGFALSVVICLTALCTINGSILTGGRMYYALGRDVPRRRLLGDWHTGSQSPRRAD